MEFLNKIELRGVVANVSLNKMGSDTIIRFSVVTETAHSDNGNAVCIETNWFNCVTWESKFATATELKKGTPVHLTGRIHSVTYTNERGTGRFWEIIVQTLEIVSL